MDSLQPSSKLLCPVVVPVCVFLLSCSQFADCWMLTGPSNTMCRQWQVAGCQRCHQLVETFLPQTSRVAYYWRSVWYKMCSFLPHSFVPIACFEFVRIGPLQLLVRHCRRRICRCFVFVYVMCSNTQVCTLLGHSLINYSFVCGQYQCSILPGKTRLQYSSSPGQFGPS